MRTVATWLGGLTLVLAGCASTAVESSWKDPSAGAVAFDRLVVVAPSREETFRRSMEDQMVKELGGTQSYKALGDLPLTDDAHIAQALKQRGYDGAVVMRITRIHQTAWGPTYWPGPVYAYYGGPIVYDPGYPTVDTSVSVETKVYSLGDDKLVWSSTSNTLDPSSTRQVIKDVSKVTSKKMLEDDVSPYDK